VSEERRRKLLSVTGVVPLAAWLAFHLFEVGSATGGRRAFAASLTGANGGAFPLVLETVLVLVPLAVHGALGVWVTATDRPVVADGYASAGARVLSRAAGVGVLLFLVVHLGHTWVAKLGGAGAEVLYDVLRGSVGQPLYVLVYVVGVTCVAFHLGLGLGALPHVWGVPRTDGGRRAARGVAVALGAIVWIASMNTLSHFAVGRAFIGGSSAPESEVEP